MWVALGRGSIIFTTCSELRKVLFLVQSVCVSCLCNISGTAGRICAKFTTKTSLVPRSDEFKGQGQRSRSARKKVFFGPFSSMCGSIYLSILWTGVQPTLDPYAEAFNVCGLSLVKKSLGSSFFCDGLGWVSQLLGWVGLGQRQWTHGYSSEPESG